MENYIINILNSLGLEEKDDLFNIFKGVEHLLTEQIEKNVIVKKYVDRLNETASRGLKVTTFSLISTIVMFVLSFLLKNNEASIIIFGASFCLAFITAISAILLVFTIGAYHSALAESKKKMNEKI